MFGSTILEVAIGLAFVYLLVSLIVSATNELIASVLKWRARTLEQGIRNLLNDPPRSGLADDLYKHPLIQGLYDKGKLPSYIPSRTFALALLDIVAGGKNGIPRQLADIRTAIAGNDKIDPAIKHALLIMIDTASADLRRSVSDFTKLQENIEIWFNNAMDRVAGWYKRKTQVLLLILSALFTVSLNIDTILITSSLSTDAVLREAIVEQAKEIAKQPSGGAQPASPAGSPPPSTPQTGSLVPREASSDRNPEAQTGMQVSLSMAQDPTPGPQQPDQDIIRETIEAKQKLVESITTLQATGVPVGWNAEKNIPGPGDDPIWWLLKFLGLAFTTVAASMGAPFWFDMLNKFISIRSTGKAPEEAPKAPKEVPTPLEPGQLPGQADALSNAGLIGPAAGPEAQPPLALKPPDEESKEE